MVVGILAVLMTIVTVAATGAIKQARSRKADALVAMVQAGIATYYAQFDEWPDFDGNGKSGNYKLSDGSTDSNRYQLTDSESDGVMRELVGKSVSGTNPLLDIMGLFVADARRGITDKTYGMDMTEAIHGSKRNPQKLKNVNNMAFGYPDESTGRFRRFKMVYSIPADQLTVSKK